MTEPKKIEAVVFDLDGTLADTLADIADSTNRVLAARGLPTHERSAYGLFVGEGVTRLVARVLPSDAQHLADEVATAFKEDYAEHLLDETRPYAGIPELVDALVARQLPLAVLSNKPDWATQEVVRTLFPSAPFAAVVGFREEVPRKPDPTAALAIAAQLRVPPQRCALVGDTATDMKTAVAAGMVPIGVLWGFRERPELVSAGARVLIETPSRMLDLFD